MNRSAARLIATVQLPRSRGADAAADDGSVLLLLLGLVVLSALLITVVIDVSALFIGRRDVLAAADGAALAGAQGVDEAAVYRDGVQGALPLDPARVRANVDQYLRDAASPSVSDLRWQVVTDGTRVQVVVSGKVRLPVVNAVVSALVPDGTDGVTVTASAAARSAVLP